MTLMAVGKTPDVWAAAVEQYGIVDWYTMLQGENDIRVPKEEAEQVASILKNAGKTVDVHYYPNEGHGFAKRENQIDAIRRMIDWFDRYLK